MSGRPGVSMLRRLAIALVAVLAAGAGYLFWPAGVPSFESVRAQWVPSDGVLLDRHGEVIDRVRLDMKVRRGDWVPLEDVSPALVEAVVAAEDHRYWEHGGVDWIGVAGALRDTLQHGRRRGGSTITMQVAALLPGGRVPSGPAWYRKLEQVRVARGLQRRWSRTQVLEAYLNLAGFRGEIRGIDAAATELAGRTPGSLDAADSAVIAALLPAPNAAPDAVARRACRRAGQRPQAPDCNRLRAVADQMLVAGRAPIVPPRIATQLAHELLRRPGERVRSTLDADLQRLATQALDRQLGDVADRNVRDGAVLVADTQSGEVLAYVASAAGTSRAKSVDGIRAHRQAGSTLKPFLYELAIERRYLTAASLLDDSPIDLATAGGLYIPQNYDRGFKGRVSVRTALGNSLNVPAVRALVLTGVEPFRQRLSDLGYDAIVQDGEFYGYSLALGSAEVSLWEQAQAYRAMARGGRWSPLRVTGAAPEVAERQVLDPAAAYVVTDILSDPAARALTFGPGSLLDTTHRSAVKTGTSKDMRDNWCIGFSPRYVVAVWIGNFEGDPMHDVSGVTGAAPVWSELMAELHRGAVDGPVRPPPRVVSSRIRFEQDVEAPRNEYFVAGTETERVRIVTPDRALARIRRPVDRTTIALDPDIPPARQRVAIEVSGDPSGLRLRIGDTVLGPASRTLLWKPTAGRHRLVLEDASGRELDHVALVVR
ncbi:MAG: penicillin-binding protein 1C [Steroidobacteraceae bacterium]